VESYLREKDNRRKKNEEILRRKEDKTRVLESWNVPVSLPDGENCYSKYRDHYRKLDWGVHVRRLMVKDAFAEDMKASCQKSGAKKTGRRNTKKYSKFVLDDDYDEEYVDDEYEEFEDDMFVPNIPHAIEDLSVFMVNKRKCKRTERKFAKNICNEIDMKKLKPIHIERDTSQRFGKCDQISEEIISYSIASEASDRRVLINTHDFHVSYP